MVNNTFALQSYKFFNAIGDGFFSAAANAYVTSYDDRKMTYPLMSIGAVCKLVSMLPFYAEAQIRDTQAHPISGTSFPALTGLLSANFAALAGNTPISKTIAKTTSLFGASALSYLNRTIVYHTPSTLMRANAPVCVNSNDSFHNTSNRSCVFGYPMPERNASMWPPVLLNMVTSFSISYAAFDTYRMERRPLQQRVQTASGSLKSLYARVKVVAASFLFLSCPIIHIMTMQISQNYRLVAMPLRQLPLSNTPYLLAITINRNARFESTMIVNVVLSMLPLFLYTKIHIFPLNLPVAPYV